MSGFGGGLLLGPVEVPPAGSQATSPGVINASFLPVPSPALLSRGAGPCPCMGRGPRAQGRLLSAYSPSCRCPGSGLVRSPRAWVPMGPREPSNRSFSLHACLSQASCAWKGRSVLGCPGHPGSGLWALPGGREPLGGSCCPSPWRLAFLGLAVGSRRTGVWQQARRPGSAVFACGKWFRPRELPLLAGAPWGSLSQSSEAWPAAPGVKPSASPEQLPLCDLR